MPKSTKKGAKPGGHTRLVVQVREDQVTALVSEAEKRRKPGQVRADVSAVVRDALDAYVPKRR